MTVRTLGADELDVAAAMLGAGEVVGIPTDTVYGLAACLGDAAAIAALFAAKGRPRTAPIAVLCSTTEEASTVATRWPAAAVRLAAAYWPGPLTIVVAGDPGIATPLGATDGVGLRVPADALCLALLTSTGPLAVTSANLHGGAPSTSAARLAAVFAGSSVAAVVDGGIRDGAVSTVIDLAGPDLVVVRAGAIDPAAATRVAATA